MKYPKINSLYKREGWYFSEDIKKNPSYQKGRQTFIMGDYAQYEFRLVKEWCVEEKIDGTNIRVIYENGTLKFRGKKDDSQIPGFLLDYLQEKFKIENFPGTSITLFGEGYGPKIQKVGSLYADEVGFVLFDVYCDGMWLNRSNVKEIADELNVPIAPYIGSMSESEILDFVKSKPLSVFSKYPLTIEGVVCKTTPLLLSLDGTPLMFKLKCKEF
jgi:ATP-dependent RNA circularization protein (DNA/RNA ligase family)